MKELENFPGNNKKHKLSKWLLFYCVLGWFVMQEKGTDTEAFKSGVLPDFPSSSAGKESTWNARDTCSIPGLGRPPGEGIGYPLQYSWASLVTQMVKNLPAIQETLVQFLGWEDRLEKG